MLIKHVEEWNARTNRARESTVPESKNRKSLPMSKMRSSCLHDMSAGMRHNLTSKALWGHSHVDVHRNSTDHAAAINKMLMVKRCRLRKRR